MHKQCTILFLLWLWVSPAIGQIVEADSLRTLPDINIHAHGMLSWSTGQYVQRLDSGLIREYDSGSLSDLLLEHSGLFIKSYGPGALSGPSLRGGGSGQTTVVWNNLNMQSSMNGQLDLSLIPVNMVQDLYVQHGGGSTLFGSGAIGGSIHLHNRPFFGKGSTIGLKNTLASFGRKVLGAELSLSKKKFYSSSNVLSGLSDGWTDHASYHQKAFMQTLGYQFSSKDIIWGQFWGQQYGREIPFSQATQEDVLLRSHLEWNHIETLWKSNLRAAFVQENLQYEDSLTAVYSDNQAQKLLLEGDVSVYLNPTTSLHLGVNFLTQQAVATAYDFAQPNRNEQALFISLKKNWLNERWTAALSIRQSWLAKQAIPLNPSIGVEGQILKKWKLFANVSRNYRIPTFNDLYWQPGGNLNLLPESGWGEELGLKTEKLLFKKVFVQTNLNFFNRQVNNWIIWLPGPSYWSPDNVKRVWSRGLELGSTMRFNSRNWNFSGRIDYSWVKSTRQFILSPQDAGKNKQLIYVPHHQLKIFGKASHNRLKLFYSHQIVDRRFTTSDNLYYLPAYQLGNLKISYRVPFKQVAVDVGFRIANLWNTSYQIVSGRPMPLRNYSLNLSVYYQN